MEYFTTPEAADRLKLSPRTLEKWRVTGKGPKFRKMGGAVRYTSEDLRQWAERAVRSSTSDSAPPGEHER